MQSTHKDICEKNKIVLDFYAAIMVRNKGRFSFWKCSSKLEMSITFRFWLDLQMVFLYKTINMDLVGMWIVPMRLFHLVTSRNMWLIFKSKIELFLNLVKHTSKKFQNLKDSKYALIFFSDFSGYWVISNFGIFHQIKFAKIYLKPMLPTWLAETGS